MIFSKIIIMLLLAIMFLLTMLIVIIILGVSKTENDYEQIANSKMEEEDNKNFKKTCVPVDTKLKTGGV